MSHSTADIPPPSSDDDDDRPAPKRAKVFRACAQCVSAKTRCEDVKPKGCWLCRRKRKACSLAGAIPTVPSPQPASRQVLMPPTHSDRDGGDWSRRSSAHTSGPAGYGTSSNMALIPGGSGDGRMGSNAAGMELAGQPSAEARISASEQRISALERELKELRNRVMPVAARPLLHGMWSLSDGQLAAPANTFLTPSSSDELGHRPSRIINIAHFARLHDFNESIFSFSSLSSYPSVVTAGILHRSDVDLAFHSFKHHFSSLLPLGPFLSISTPTPTNNFVILACLHHVPAYPADKLTDLVDKSIITALSGNTDLDIVLALLILALAPAVPCKPGDDGPRPSPLRLISIAYQLGRDLGLDAKVQGYLARGNDLLEPFWAEPLQIVQLWTAVINRYNLLHLMHGHGRPLPTSLAPLIPYSSDSNVQRITNHLMDEHRLAHFGMEAMKPLMAVEDGALDFEVVKRSMLQFQSGMEGLIGWKRDGGSALLDLDQRCLEHVAVSRLSFLFQRIPSPLQPIRQTLIAGMGIFVATAKRFLATLFPDNVPLHPTTYSPHFMRHTGSQSGASNPQSPFEPPQPQPQLRALEFRPPAHVYMCASLAVLSLRGTAAHMRHMEDEQLQDLITILDLERVQRAEQHLKLIGGNLAAALTEADDAFGTLEEVMAWSKQRIAASTIVAPNGQSSGGLGAHEGGIGSIPGAQFWDFANTPLASSGLFDFDLFSWDPTALGPDWMTDAGMASNSQDQSSGHGGVQGFQMGAGPSDSGILGPFEAVYPAIAAPTQTEDELRHDWKNALR